jgi:glycosyltransferase involved in cell wall biosynthesis
VTPKVSVCVPAFNRAKYIGDTIRSVLAQTLQDFEIIVYDDASTDETAEVVAQLKDDRLSYYRQPQNVGIAKNRTSCIRAARGKYIAWLDADDLYYPQAIETQSRLLDNHPNVALVHSAYDVIDHAGQKLPDWPPPFSEDTVENAPDALAELVQSNYICAPTVMVRRVLQLEAGDYSKSLRDSSEDWEMWMRLAARGDIAYIAQRLAKYRVHESSASAATSPTGDRLKEDIRAVREFFSRRDLAISDKQSLTRRANAALAAKALLHSGDVFTRGGRFDALADVALALRLWPQLFGATACLLMVNIACGDEYGTYRRSKRLLKQVSLQLTGSRFGRRIDKLATTAPAWDQALAEIAIAVRSVVPALAAIAVIDKWDPTILHLSRRKGWHFPDRKLLPNGYPSNSEAVIDHLGTNIRRGVRYLVVPSASFWWLEFYEAFARHLNTQHQIVLRDPNCVIYRLLGSRGHDEGEEDSAGTEHLVCEESR